MCYLLMFCKFFKCEQVSTGDANISLNDVSDVLACAVYGLANSVQAVSVPASTSTTAT